MEAWLHRRVVAKVKLATLGCQPGSGSVLRHLRRSLPQLRFHAAIQLHRGYRDLLSIQSDRIGLKDSLGYAFIEFVLASASHGSQAETEDKAAMGRDRHV